VLRRRGPTAHSPVAARRVGRPRPRPVSAVAVSCGETHFAAALEASQRPPPSRFLSHAVAGRRTANCCDSRSLHGALTPAGALEATDEQQAARAPLLASHRPWRSSRIPAAVVLERLSRDRVLHSARAAPASTSWRLTRRRLLSQAPSLRRLRWTRSWNIARIAATQSSQRGGQHSQADD
jgi:hypothetical protein